MRYVFVVLLLTSCATDEARLRERQAMLDRTCTGYGFQRGSEAYKQCWMQVDQRDRARGAGAGGPVVCSPVGNATICQ